MDSRSARTVRIHWPPDTPPPPPPPGAWHQGGGLREVVDPWLRVLANNATGRTPGLVPEIGGRFLGSGALWTSGA